MAILVVTYNDATGGFFVQKIGSAQISDGAILSGKIGLLAVGTPHIADGAVTSAKLASGAGGAPLADGAVTSAKLASGAVGGVHIKDSSIGGTDLANQAVTSAKIGVLAVGRPHIAALAIVSGKVASGGLSPLTSGKIWAGFTGNMPREEDKPAAGGATILYKPDDQIVNNSETLVNDEDLVLAVGANEVWIIQVVLQHISVSGVPGLDYAFAVPSGGSIGLYYQFQIANRYELYDGTTERNTQAFSVVLATAFYALYVGGGTAGNLQLQWAQHTATAENTTMKINSLMVCHKLA